MATRNLTDVFIMMRNNSAQSRHFYNEQRSTDRAALVEESLLSGGEVAIGLPPLWADQLDECQYTLQRLKTTIKELDGLHQRHALTPRAFSDSSDDHHEIEALTREITRMFSTCHKLVANIKIQSIRATTVEKRLAQNAMSSLVNALQQASVDFKTTQNKYIKTLNSREQTTSAYLEPLDTGQEPLDQIDLAFAQGSNQKLLMLEEENTRIAEQREREVQSIVQSIQDLNSIFKDLAHMVTEQGTVLDRIDYNLERSCMQVQAGFQQLQKAERYQQNNRKMTCIIGLAIATTVMFLLLVAVKFN